jgi:F-type H+-transporting ATPase subunit b
MKNQAASALGPLAPDLSELIIGAIAFLIVFGLLYRVLYPRIQKTLAERTDAIEGGIERAKEAENEADRLKQQFEAQLADARHESARLREQAAEEGAALKARRREEGEAEYQRLVSAAQTQIDANREQAMTSLRAEVGALAVELASRIVGESLADEARQRRTVDRFLAELEEQPGPADGVKASR